MGLVLRTNGIILKASNCFRSCHRKCRSVHVCVKCKCSLLLTVYPTSRIAVLQRARALRHDTLIMMEQASTYTRIYSLLLACSANSPRQGQRIRTLVFCRKIVFISVIGSQLGLHRLEQSPPSRDVNKLQSQVPKWLSRRNSQTPLRDMWTAIKIWLS